LLSLIHQANARHTIWIESIIARGYGAARNASCTSQPRANIFVKRLVLAVDLFTNYLFQRDHLINQLDSSGEVPRTSM
jgi:hypothetical protein